MTAVLALVPSLSRSLAERFSVFRVMHHGTHEKQISNVFAWLLRADGTHGFRDTFQRLFVEQVNRALPEEAQLSTTGYRVEQEVDTSGHDALGKDIADIVLSSRRASLVVENFESSDGHGYDYRRYLAHGAAGGKQSVVVLLCARREPHRQKGGWEQAIALSYAELPAQHAQRKFEEGRKTLAQVKRALKRFAAQTLMAQVNEALETETITAVEARFVGQWEWCVTLLRANSAPRVFLEFGPTAVVENGQAPETLDSRDYTRVFVTRQATGHDGVDRIIQTEVGLGEVLAGFGR